MLIDKNIAAKIRPHNVRSYLEKTGWHIKKHLSDDLIVYARNEDDKYPYLEFRLLTDVESPYYADTLLQSAKRVMMLENRSLSDVLNRFYSPNIDHLEYRIKSQFCETGMLELGKVEIFLDSILGGLKSAAMDISSPRIHHSRVRSELISNLIESAKFGQTQPGSFVMNLYIPTGIAADQSESADQADTTLYRDVLVHYIVSLNRAVKAIRSGNMEDFVSDNEQTHSVSANLLSSITSSDVWEDNEIDIKVDWSPLYAIPDQTPSFVSIKKGDFSDFRKLVHYFSPKIKKERGVFAGYITGLYGFGEVKMRVLTSEGEINAKAFLEDDDYAKAAQWHVESKPVYFSAVLQRSGLGSMGTIENIKGLRELAETNNSIPKPSKPKKTKR